MDPNELLRALVNVAITTFGFLEAATDEEMDPDWCAKIEEALVYELMRLDPAVKEELVKEMLRQADEADREGNAKRAVFLRGAPYAIGLTDTEPS